MVMSNDSELKQLMADKLCSLTTLSLTSKIPKDDARSFLPITIPDKIGRFFWAIDAILLEIDTAVLVSIFIENFGPIPEDLL